MTASKPHKAEAERGRYREALAHAGESEERLLAERDRFRDALRRIAAGDVPGTGDWGECLQAHARETLDTSVTQS